MATHIYRLPANHGLSPVAIRAMEAAIDAFLQGMVNINPVGMAGIQGAWNWTVTSVTNGVNQVELR